MTDDITALVTALSALVAAIGAVAAVFVGFLNRKAAAASKVAAEAAKVAAERTDERLIVVEGAVVEIGPAIDGRLTELLASETGRARAEGIAAGEQQQRDRNSQPHPGG